MGHTTLLRTIVITNTMLKKSDGGAIYNYNVMDSHSATRSEQFHSYCCRQYRWHPPNTSRVAHGIYLDYGCHDMIVQATRSSMPVVTVSLFNTTLPPLLAAITCCMRAGTMVLNSSKTRQWLMGRILSRVTYSTHWIYTERVRTVVDLYTANKTAAILHSPGTIDSNYYCNPYGKSVSVPDGNL